MLTAAGLDRIFAPWARRDSPGAVVAVTHHGDEVVSGAYGMADLGQGVALDRQSVLRIGSQTKQFTVLLALLLEQEGKLCVDHEVQRYAPWLPRYSQPVTLHHLASNRSGLRDFLEIMTWSGLPLAAHSTRKTARELIARHAELNYPPGAEMLYSNTGFFLLSEIIEEVSGRSYNELLTEHITSRVGMPDTRLLRRDSETLPRLAVEHLRDADGSWRKVAWGFPLGGEGGMVSTLPDMVAWQAALTRPPEWLAPLLARMEAPVAYSNGTVGLYSLGLTVEHYRGHLCIGHGGGTAGARSQSTRFPGQEFGVVILGNAGELAPFELARRVADEALPAELDPLPDPAGLRRAAQAAGLYRHEGGDDVFAIEAAGERPVFRSSGGVASITEIAPGVFAPERPTMHLTFSVAGDGALDAVWCGAGRRYRRLAPEAARGSIIAGHYARPELRLDVTVNEAMTMLIRSDVGALRVGLSWIDDDLLAVRPMEAPEGAPWMATLLVTPQGLALTTDRTKRLMLLRQ